MKREIRTISEKLKSRMTSGEEGIDLICSYADLIGPYTIGYLKAKVK